jgi:hypothetical protein
MLTLIMSAQLSTRIQYGSGVGVKFPHADVVKLGIL